MKMQVNMTDKEIIFLVDCSTEPYGEDGKPLYGNLYPIFGGWREFAYWRLSRKFARPSEEYEATEREVYPPDEFMTDTCAWLSGYHDEIVRPSNYDTPHP